jgi:hypothetical protein
MLTKVVNGVVVQMSAEEEAATRAGWSSPPALPKQPQPSVSVQSQRCASLKTFPTYVPVNIPLSFKPTSVAYDGNGSMFACGTGTDGTARIVKVFLLNNALLFDTVLPAGSNPVCIAVAGGTVWVSNYSGNSVSVVDSISGSLIQTIAIPGSIGVNPEGIVCTGKSVWVALNSSYTIAKYDVATRTWLRTDTVGKYPGWMAYSDGYLYVSVGGDGPSFLKKIRESDMSVIWSAPTGQYPLAVVRSNDGYVWVGAYWGCNVTRINEETGEVVGTYALSGTPRGGACDGETVSFTVFPYNGVGTFHGLTMFTLDGVKVGDFPTGQFPRAVATDGLNHYVANSDSLYLTKL